MVALAHVGAEGQVTSGEQGPMSATTAMGASAPHDYQGIIFFADLLDDLEGVRIANENRHRTLTRSDEWGKDVPEHMVVAITWQIERIREQEKAAIFTLEREVRNSPLAGWLASDDAKGVGAKTLGRLIKEIGDPAWNHKEQRPRQLRELYAYCGLHVIDSQAPRRMRGERANWSTEAKKRTYLIADTAVKAGVRKIDEPDDSDGYDVQARKAISRYGQFYLDARTKYADATHPRECVRCGPKGNPALEGSPLSAGHQHARALRIVMKAILRDLFEAAGGTISRPTDDPDATDRTESR